MAGRQDRPTGSWARQHPPLPEPESADELIWAVFGALRAGRPTRADQAIRALAVRVGPGSREVGVLTTMLHDCLSAAWDSGWQPADLHRLTERRLEDEACVLLRDAMAAHLATFSAARVHPRWHDQLTALDARCWWDPSGSYLDARLQRWGVEAQAEASLVFGATIRLAHLLSTLPALPRLDALPGTYQERTGRAAASRAGVDPRILTRVRALLAKAESTTFEAEADTFTAGAQALMARHSIDAAMLAEQERLEADESSGIGGGTDAIRIGVDRPYEKPKAWLLSIVADANRCRSVWSEPLGFATVVGFPADLQATETIFTSLLVQSAQAMQLAGSRSTPWGSSRTRSFRHSFLMSYAERIGERLTQVIEEETRAAQERRAQVDDGVDGLREATAEPAQGAGRELVLVLAERSQEVAGATERLFPTVVTRNYSGGSDAEGWLGGRRAADTARLGAGPELTDARGA